MNKEIKLEDCLNLYDNFTNYIYKVNDKCKDIGNKYISFNPSIHYWMLLDDISLDIFTYIQKFNNIGIVKQEIIKKYNINEEIFNRDALSIINEFYKNMFFTTKRNTPKEDKWMSAKVNLDESEKYPFNDIYISLSDSCNLNCIYCFNKESRKLRCQSNKKISYNEIVAIMKQFKELHGTGVVFTGGEPTLNKNLIPLCKEAKRIGLNTHFITNGTLLNKINLDDLAVSVDSFAISLDSIVQEEIDVLWNTKGISIKNDLLDKLVNINEFSKSKKILDITIMPIISKVNINSMTKLVTKIHDVLKDCNLSWKMTQYSPIENEEIDNKMMVSQEEYHNVVIECMRILNYSDLNSTNDSFDKNKLENQIKAFALSEGGKLLPPIKPKLLTCAPSYFVANNGDIFPCQGFEKKDYKIGNYFEGTLKEFFNSKGFGKVRDKIVVNNNKECTNCELRFVCTNKCGGCISSCSMDKDKCKELTIKRLFLQTQV